MSSQNSINIKTTKGDSDKSYRLFVCIKDEFIKSKTKVIVLIAKQKRLCYNKF